MIKLKEDNSLRQALTLAPLAWLRSTRSTIAQHPGKPERRSLVLHWRVLTVFSALLDAGSEVNRKSRRLLKKEAMVFQLTVENGKFLIDVDFRKWQKKVPPEAGSTPG